MQQDGRDNYGMGGLGAIAYAPSNYVGAALKDYPSSLFILDSSGVIHPVHITGNRWDGQFVSAAAGLGIALGLYVGWLGLIRLYRYCIFKSKKLCSS